MAFENSSRLIKTEESFIAPGKGYAYGSVRRLTNLTMGGQNGVSPDLRYIVGNAAHISRNVDCILLEAPRAFRYLPDSEIWVASLKSLVEQQAETIDGLNKSIHVEFAQTQVGGNEQQEDVTRVSRDRSEVSFKWTDRKGMPINRFFEQWIILFLGHPDTQVPGIIAMDDTYVSAANKAMFAHLPDMIGMTCLFYETDETKMRVQKAYLITNMMPDGAGDVTSRKDLTAAGEKSEITVKFTGTQQVGTGVDLFAQKILNNLDKTGLNPDTRRAFFDDGDDSIDTLVRQAKSQIDGKRVEMGYFQQAKDIGKSGKEHYRQAPANGSGVSGTHGQTLNYTTPTSMGDVEVTNS